MKKRKVMSLLLAGVMMVTAFSITGCENKAAEAEEESLEEEALEVSVVSPKMGDVSVETEYMGTLEPQDETSVFAKMSGEVTETFFEVGDVVNEGDVLFTLDDESAKLQMRTANATYKTAQVGADNQNGALAMNRDSNVDGLLKAQESLGSIQDNYNYIEYQYGQLEEQRDYLEEDKDNLEDKRHEANKKYKKAKEAYKEAKEWGADPETLAELKSVVDSLKSSVESLDDGIDSIELQMEGIDTQEYGLNVNKRNSITSYGQAVRGVGLAQENLDYFDNYTAPGTQKSTEASLESAQVAVDSAKLQLDYTKITAPVSGVIEEKNVDKHGMAQAGSPAYVITNRDSMMAVFYVTEDVYRELSLGQEVAIDRNGDSYTGKISELPVTIDSDTNLFKIKATVNGNTADFVSGTAVKLTLVTSHADNIMTIPVDCVYYESEKAFVYTAVDGKIVKSYVETGLFNDESIQIVSGLSADDSIITTWSSDLRDGLEVIVSAEDTGDKEE